MPEVFTAASVTFCIRETVFVCVCFVPGSLYIHNASGIQIGSNNTMSIRGYDPCNSLSSLNASANSPIQEGILKYGKP